MSKEERDKFDKENDLPSNDEIWDEFLNPENKTKDKDAWSDFSKEEPEEVIIDDIGASKSNESKSESNQEEKAKKSPFEPNPFGEGGIYYETNSLPLSWIGGDKNYKLVEKTQKNNKDTNTWYYPVTRTFLACKPVRIVHDTNLLAHVLPSENRDLYTIEFKGLQKSCNFTINSKSKSEIVSQLKERFTLSEYGIDIAIHTQILAFEHAGLLEENEVTQYEGFFLDKHEKLFTSKIEIKEPNKTAISQALDVIEESKKYYEDRLDLLATTLKWGMIAPLSFVIKQKGRFLKWLHYWGESSTSKSSVDRFVLALDGHEKNEQYIRGITNVDSIARLENTLCENTFPKLVDEVNLSINDNTKFTLSQFKIAMDHLIFRTRARNMKIEDKPSCCSLMITSNFPPPSDNAYKRRIIDRDFSTNESHSDTSDIAIEFTKFKLENLHKLAALGNFRNYYIVNNSQLILEEIEKIDVNLLDVGLKPLTEAYKYCDRDVPEWLNLVLEEKQLEESIEDNALFIKSSLEKLVHTSWRNAILIWKKEDIPENVDTPGTKLIRLIDRNELSDFKRRPDGKITISKAALIELYKNGLNPDQCANLKILAYHMNAVYRKYYGNNYVVIDAPELIDYLDNIEE